MKTALNNVLLPALFNVVNNIEPHCRAWIVYTNIVDVICKQRVWVFHQGIQTRENGVKHEREARVFYCFRVFGSPDDTLKLVVYI